MFYRIVTEYSLSDSTSIAPIWPAFVPQRFTGILKGIAEAVFNRAGIVSGIFRVIGQKVCVKSAVNLDRYWVYSTFIFFDKDKGWTKSVCKNMREPT